MDDDRGGRSLTHKYRAGSPYEDTWHRDGVRLDETGNATELVAAEALRRIEEQRSPWFVYVPFHAVHTPVDAPEEYKRLYDGTKFHDDPVLHESRLRMAAMVSQLDAKVGEFVNALERTGQRERTLIVFTSDNGGIESLKNAYVGGVPDSPLNSENDPLRGQKATVYEGGIRVCALANWPGTLAPRKFERPMHAVDWFPTIAGLVGYQPEADLRWDGINQWAALSGTGDSTASRSIYIASRNGHALRHGDWKVVQLLEGDAQLFHLSVDPFETTDLAAAETGKLAELQSLLREQMARDEPELPADLVDVPK
jgi:arylsulfatase A-like enzyme